MRELRLGAYRAMTGQAGLAQIRMPKGTYELHVWKVGYEAPPRTVEIDDDVSIHDRGADGYRRKSRTRAGRCEQASSRLPGQARRRASKGHGHATPSYRISGPRFQARKCAHLRMTEPIPMPAELHRVQSGRRPNTNARSTDTAFGAVP